MSKILKKLNTADADVQDRLYNYVCKVLKWLDGDTLEVEIDMGFEVYARKKVRVYGINAREVHSKDPNEKSMGIKATLFAQSIAPVSGYVLIKSHKANKEQEKFGRWLADIRLADGRDFATVMKDQGYAVPYFGGKR